LVDKISLWNSVNIETTATIDDKRCSSTLARLVLPSDGRTWDITLRVRHVGIYVYDNVGTEKRREKVVVLRELQRGIIYTKELSKQAIEGHVSTAFIVYEGARLTGNIDARQSRKPVILSRNFP
jgi:hypothetical protein